MLPDQKTWGGVIRHISTSSAVNPTLVASIAAMVLGVGGLTIGPASASLVFAILTLAPLTVFLCQVIFFTFVDRDRLQNDKHVEQKMLISRGIGSMINGKPVEFQIPADSPIVSNPTYQGRDE